MIAIKYTGMEIIPGYCDDCIYYECRPHPYKGWTQACALTMEKMDDDAPEGWIYDGNGRPKNCPIIDARENVRGSWKAKIRPEWQTFDECECSNCGAVEYFNVEFKKFNFCPNCGADMRKEA